MLCKKKASGDISQKAGWSKKWKILLRDCQAWERKKLNGLQKQVMMHLLVIGDVRNVKNHIQAINLFVLGAEQKWSEKMIVWNGMDLVELILGAVLIVIMLLVCIISKVFGGFGKRRQKRWERMADKEEEN